MDTGVLGAQKYTEKIPEYLSVYFCSKASFKEFIIFMKKGFSRVLFYFLQWRLVQCTHHPRMVPWFVISPQLVFLSVLQSAKREQTLCTTQLWPTSAVEQSGKSGIYSCQWIQGSHGQTARVSACNTLRQ